MNNRNQQTPESYSEQETIVIKSLHHRLASQQGLTVTYGADSEPIFQDGNGNIIPSEIVMQGLFDSILCELMNMGEI